VIATVAIPNGSAIRTPQKVHPGRSMMNEQTTIRGAIILCVMMATAAWSTAMPAEPLQKIAVGVYFNEGNRCCPDSEQAFVDLQQQTGRLAKVYLNFQSWTEQWNQFSTRLADNSLKHGGIFMVVWMPAAGEDRPGHSDPRWSCKAIAGGRHDAYLKKYAADVKQWGKPVMIRLAHEMNGRWYPYGTAMDAPGVRHNGNTPADYVAMWRHVWDVFHEAEATNVYWVWSPNILFVNAENTVAQQQADYVALYPGDRYVDWIGLDGYCDGVKGRWKSFAELFDASYRAITALCSKPLMIAEFACSEAGAPPGTSKADWITRTYMVEIPERYPRIKLVNWFDRDKTKQGETDWRFNSSPKALSAYSAAVNSPLYQGEVKLRH
jgi:hypothetical protein